jgi:hypothetical protein
MRERCCYYVQTHRDPEQIYRLVRSLRRGSPGSAILVLHDFGASDLDWTPLGDLDDVHLIRAAYRQVRGTWSGQAQPLLDAIAHLERAGIDYDWLVTLTGQDYPVMPLAAFEGRLRGSGSDGFLRFWDVDAAGTPWPRHKGRRRYWYQYRRLPPRWDRFLPLAKRLSRLVPGVHLSLDYGPNLGLRALRTPWRGGFRCYGGWTWVSLRREAARFLLQYLDAHPGLAAFYRRTMSPEESVVPTVLVNAARFRLENDDLRFIDYQRAVRGAPRTLSAEDLPALASGRYAFARKFEWSGCRELLDTIDVELLGTAAG